MNETRWDPYSKVSEGDNIARVSRIVFLIDFCYGKTVTSFTGVQEWESECVDVGIRLVENEIHIVMLLLIEITNKLSF